MCYRYGKLSRDILAFEMSLGVGYPYEQCDHVKQTAKLQAMAQVPGKFTYAIITFCVYTDHGGMIALAHWSYYTGLDQKTSENLEDYVKWKVNMIENILESVYIIVSRRRGYENTNVEPSTIQRRHGKRTW